MKIVNSIDSETENVICAKLREFNNANCKYFATHSREENKQNFLIYDKKELIGAGLGVVRYNWFYLDILYIDESYRKQHLGKAYEAY